MDEKIRPIKMLSTRDSLQDERYKKTESERMEKVFNTNENKKKVGTAILPSEKSDFITKTVTRDKEGNYIMIKRSIQEEGIMCVNIHTPNIGAPKDIKQMLT